MLTWNPSTPESETWKSFEFVASQVYTEVQGELELHSKNLSKKKKKNLPDVNTYKFYTVQTF